MCHGPFTGRARVCSSPGKTLRQGFGGGHCHSCPNCNKSCTGVWAEVGAERGNPALRGSLCMEAVWPLDRRVEVRGPAFQCFGELFASTPWRTEWP